MSRVYNTVTSCATQIFDTCAEISSKIIKETITLYESGNTEKAEAKFKCFQKHLHEIAGKQNKFLDYIHVCISCVASQDKYHVTESLNNI